MAKHFPSRRPDFSYHGLVVPCAICHSHDHELLTKRDRDGYKTFKTLCRSCGLVYTNPLPTIEELQAFYQAKFSKMSSGGFQLQLGKVHQAGIRALSRFHRIKPYLSISNKILDASACLGELCYLLKKYNYEVEGIDCNPHFVKYAEEKLGINLQLHFLDNISLKNDEYDVIISHHILNLSLHPLQLMQKYYEALKPNGYLNLEIPNIESHYHAPFNRFRFKHFYNFNARTIEMLAAKTGFTILNMVIIPKKHHINVIMKKAQLQPIKVHDNANYIQVRSNIVRYTNFRYIFSKTPYLKIINNLKKKWLMQKVNAKFSDAKAVLDKLYLQNNNH